MFIKYLWVFVPKYILGFITLESQHIIDEYTLPRYTHLKLNEFNDINLFWENENYLNYTDKLYKTPKSIPTGEHFTGLCSNVNVYFTNNKSHVIGNISYYQMCNMSGTVYWNWNMNELCNTSSTICKKTWVDDIFHIHRKTFRVIHIENNKMVYEQIAYIQPEIWMIGLCIFFVIIFGLYSYNASETGKIVT